MENVFYSQSESTDRLTAPTAIERKVEYLNPAAVTDVMYDQLEYLIAHASDECRPDCLDCTRLAQVRDCLLLPFRPVVP
jgi:hypothetical protein